MDHFDVANERSAFQQRFHQRLWLRATRLDIDAHSRLHRAQRHSADCNLLRYSFSQELTFVPLFRGQFPRVLRRAPAYLLSNLLPRNPRPPKQMQKARNRTSPDGPERGSRFGEMKRTLGMFMTGTPPALTPAFSVTPATLSVSHHTAECDGRHGCAAGLPAD